MAYSERESKIIAILKGRQTVTNREIRERLYVSPATLRRDLHRMEEKGLITRLHGSCRLNYRISEEAAPKEYREQIAYAETQKIAKAASGLIRNGDVLFLDGSDTSYGLIPFLGGLKDLIVITNGVKNAYLLAEMGIQTIVTGGRIVDGSFSMVGREAVTSVRNYNADIAFISASMLSTAGDLSTELMEEGDVRREMILHARKRVLLIESRKFYGSAFMNYSNLSEIDEMITETAVPEMFRSKLRKN
ncbi:MAG: DeoR/GlpR transcriptional regulator [Lachnospiraceae bacterium]|nr:DeoR/GlpR transcriptional regulator [Lachnospiraceae bacterium]